MRTKIMVVLCVGILLIVSGCATSKAPNIYVNHAPAENFILQLTNPETQITLYSKVMRHYVHEEDNESDVWYEPIPINEIVIVDDATKDVSISLRVGNLKKVKYSLVHVYVLMLKGESIEFQFEELIYEGNFSRKEFVIKLLTNEDITRGRSHIEIRDEEGMPILFSQEVVYERKGGNTPQDY